MEEFVNTTFGQIIIVVINLGLFLIFIYAIVNFANNPYTNEELINLNNKRFQKQINNYRIDVPISKEDPFKSSKYTSQKILKARERIIAVKKYWGENKEKLKEMPFMTDELYKSTDNELNN